MMHLIATVKTIITPKLAGKSLVIITIQIMTFFKATLPNLLFSKIIQLYLKHSLYLSIE